MHTYAVILLIASLIGLFIFVAVSLLRMPPNLFMFRLLGKIFGEEEKPSFRDQSKKSKMERTEQTKRQII
jgi:hypothetical protein